MNNLLKEIDKAKNINDLKDILKEIVSKNDEDSFEEVEFMEAVDAWNDNMEIYCISEDGDKKEFKDDYSETCFYADDIIGGRWYVKK